MAETNQEPFVITKGAIYDLSAALNRGTCKNGHSLEWEADFDADGNSWSAECCGDVYSIFDHTVLADVEESDEGSEDDG